MLLGCSDADITWGAGGTTSDATMDIALAMRKMGIVTNMHLTCTNIESEKVDAALEQAMAGGIRNIVALRGDAPEGRCRRQRLCFLYFL